MKVRSKAVYEATRITEGMCRGEEGLPGGLHRDTEGDMLYACGKSGDGCWGAPGDWYLPNFWPPFWTDAEFREEFEEVGP